MKERRPIHGLAMQAILAMLALLAGSLMVLPQPATADDTEVGGMGGGVYPLETTDIRMVAETVEAVVYGGFAEYRATFLFENQVEARTVRLGFPFAALKDRTEGLPYTSVAGFRAWQDGRPLEVIPQLLHPNSDSEYDTDGYFLHEALFPLGETEITVSYLARPLISAGDRLHGDDVPPDLRGWIAAYDYWLHTGAGWRGTIGTAVVQYRFADTFLGTGVDVTRDEVEFTFPHQLTEPPGYQRPDEATVRWVFEDFEPETPTYPLRVLVNEDGYVDEVAGLFRSMDQVLEVDILTADEVAEEWKRLGPENPSTSYENNPPRPRVDAILDSYEDLETVARRIQERFPGGEVAFDRLGEDDAYPYDVILAFSDRRYDFEREGPLGPRVAASRPADAPAGDERNANLTALAVGSPVVFELEETPDIREVRVVSGDLARLDGFEQTARPKVMELTFSDGSVERLRLEDRRGVQRFPVRAPGRQVQVRVLEAYPGTASVAEVAIWEIEFGTEPAPEFAAFDELLASEAPHAPAAAEPVQGEASTTSEPPEASTDAGSRASSDVEKSRDFDAGGDSDNGGGTGWIAYLGGAAAVFLIGGGLYANGRRRASTDPK